MESGPVELGEGAVVAGRYGLLARLGEGGMGEVWSARHLVTRRSHALKFLKPGVRDKAALRERFVREARAASALRHPNVIGVQDVFDAEDGTPVMVMELLEGESLAQLLAREETLSVGRTAALLLPVLGAVASAHAHGIVHRDLKPDNIFIARTAGGEVPKVLDFGIAKLSADLIADRSRCDSVTDEGAFVGTPRYMAPEQLECRPIDPTADYWSLGVILYECLAGARPIEGDTFGEVIGRLLGGVIVPLTHVAPDVPPGLAEAVQRLLARASTDRPRSLDRVAYQLAVHGGLPPCGPFPAPVGLPVELPAYDAGLTHSTIRAAETCALPGIALPSTLPVPVPLASRLAPRPRHVAAALAAVAVAGACAWAWASAAGQPGVRPSAPAAVAPPTAVAASSAAAHDASTVSPAPAVPLSAPLTSPPQRARRVATRSTPKPPDSPRAPAEPDEARLFSGRK